MAVVIHAISVYIIHSHALRRRYLVIFAMDSGKSDMYDRLHAHTRSVLTL
jgi:hypothetical protein